MIPNTNLVLVVADTTCPCYSARISVTPTKVKTPVRIPTFCWKMRKELRQKWQKIQLLLSKLKHLRINDILFTYTYTRLTQILFLRRRVKSPKFYHFCVLAVCVFLSFSASMSLLSFFFLFLVISSCALRNANAGWDGDKQKKRKNEK